jgi:pimeloyl-ACP methyl ester carboxylesterase
MESSSNGLAYTAEGSGPLILFGHGLLADRHMFDAQIAALRDRYRCVSVDWPGHGESGYDAGGWDFYDLGRQAADLVSSLGEERAIFAGLSQGGMIFMRLALENPDIVRGLILMDTSAGPENAETLPQYEQLREALVSGDDATREATVDIVATILYGEPWRNANPDGVAHERALMLGHPREGLDLACRAVFDRDDVTERLGEISAPTLVICGELDAATTPDLSEVLAARIAGAELAMIPDAGHHSPIENPAPVTAAIESFLSANGL